MDGRGRKRGEEERGRDGLNETIYILFSKPIDILVVGRRHRQRMNGENEASSS